MSLEQDKCLNITEINSQNSGRISGAVRWQFSARGDKEIARVFESDKDYWDVLEKNMNMRGNKRNKSKTKKRRKRLLESLKI